MMLNFAAFGIILNWSSLWLIKDILAPIYLAGSIIIFFQIGAIASNVLASKLIKNLNEKIVGPYLSIIGSILLYKPILVVNNNLFWYPWIVVVLISSGSIFYSKYNIYK